MDIFKKNIVTGILMVATGLGTYSLSSGEKIITLTEVRPIERLERIEYRVHWYDNETGEPTTTLTTENDFANIVGGNTPSWKGHTYVSAEDYNVISTSSPTLLNVNDYEVVDASSSIVRIKTMEGEQILHLQDVINALK